MCIRDSHLYDDKRDVILELLNECVKAGNPDMVFKFISTSKVSFPGSGIAALAASEANLEDAKRYMSYQTIGHDKLNQLRHVRFFKDMQGMYNHMRKHADILRPKFEKVLEVLDRELGGLGIGTWTRPLGGYFISFDSLEGCAKAIVAKAKEAGLVMTLSLIHIWKILAEHLPTVCFLEVWVSASSESSITFRWLI